MAGAKRVLAALALAALAMAVPASGADAAGSGWQCQPWGCGYFDVVNTGSGQTITIGADDQGTPDNRCVYAYWRRLNSSSWVLGASSCGSGSLTSFSLNGSAYGAALITRSPLPGVNSFLVWDPTYGS